MRRPLLKFALGLLMLALVVVAFILMQANRRPSLEGYAVMPPAPAGAAIRVRYAGVATLLFDDGETSWMTDGFFSRPSLPPTALKRIAPDRAAIGMGLKRLGVTRLAAVVPLHSHYDHAMDAPLVAMKTGALLVGSESTLNVGRGLDMPEDRMLRVQPGDQMAFGRWTLTFLASRHAPLSIMRGGGVKTIDAPLVPPTPSNAWREGQTWAVLVEHASGRRMLVLGKVPADSKEIPGRAALR